jgi:hypothetical protein
VLFVFASGFLLGRVGSLGLGQPTIRELPVAEPLPFDDVKGAVAYYVLSSREPLATIAIHDLFSGEVKSRARLSPAVDPSNHVTTQVVSFGRSVAIVVSDGGRGWVAFAPYGRAQHGWIPGTDVAWLSETELFVRQADGAVVRWTADADSMAADRVGEANELLQTPSGAVVRRGSTLETLGASRRRLEVPAKSQPLAVSPDTSRALLRMDEPALWDGNVLVPVRVETGRVLGASFEPSGERVAILLGDDDGLVIAIVDQRGNASLKPIGEAGECVTVPAWDAAGRWVYVATDDGTLHAVDASGGRIEAVKTGAEGCGLAWLDVA